MPGFAAALLLRRIAEAIRALIKHRGHGEPPEPPPAPDAAWLRRDLRWIEDSYGRGKNVKHLSGFIGELVLPAMPDLDLIFSGCAVLGQHLGIGEQPAFGLGRYRLETIDAQTTNVVAPPTPARYRNQAIGPML